jgi:hypothetical protein
VYPARASSWGANEEVGIVGTNLLEFIDAHCVLRADEESIIFHIGKVLRRARYRKRNPPNTALKRQSVNAIKGKIVVGAVYDFEETIYFSITNEPLWDIREIGRKLRLRAEDIARQRYWVGAGCTHLGESWFT